MSSFVYPVFASGSIPLVLRVEGATESPPVEVPRGQAAHVVGSLGDLDRFDAIGGEVTISFASDGAHRVIGPSVPAIEDDLDAFVRRISSTRHPLVLAALVAERHVRNVPYSEVIEATGKIWSVLLSDPLAATFPDTLASECKAMCKHGGNKYELRAKALLTEVVESSAYEVVQAALRSAAARSGNEKAWLSVVATALDLLEEPSALSVRHLARALGVRAIDRPPPPPSFPPPPSAPRIHSTTFGGVELKLVETGARSNRFRVELDGRRCRVRSRKALLEVDKLLEGSHDWIEADDADLGMLMAALNNDVKRTDADGRLVLEEHEAGLSGYDADMTVTVTLASGDVVEVDMRHRVNEVNPYFGW